MSNPTDWDIADTGQPTREITFTTTEGSWLSLDVSPDGGTIVFDILGDIFSVPVDGGRATPVHGGPAMDRMPTFSPDGTRLLYLSDRDGWDNLWTSAVDGTDPTQLTHETVDQLTGPVWGPDGRSVIAAKIYSEFPRRAAAELRLFEAVAGTDPRRGRLLVEPPDNGRDVLEASCSRGGEYVYYTERLTVPTIYVDANHINFAIRRRHLVTGETETAATGFGGAIAPQVSRDGTKVAFVRRVMARTVLFVLDLATGEQRPVYDRLDRDNGAVWELQGNYFPRFAWFPDNRRIAIWAMGKIHVIDVASGEDRIVEFEATVRRSVIEPVRARHTIAPERITVRAIKHVASNPTSSEIAFTALGRIWRKIDPTAAPTAITDADVVAFDPAFSTDGRRLAYVEWSDLYGSALKVATGDGPPTVVTTSPGVIRQPSFSPDGEELVFRVQDPDPLMGGTRAKAGIYRTATDGRQPTFVTSGDAAPQFSPDARRVYLVRYDESGRSKVEILCSVTRDGHDHREHAHTPGSNTSELRVSPDLAWIAFRESHRYYVAPFRHTATALLVHADSAEVPAWPVTDQAGGFGLAWSPDSTSVHWALGPDFRRAEISESTVPAGRPNGSAGLVVDPDVPAGSTAFVNARILTMTDDTPIIEGGTVLVHGNRIVAVGAADGVAVPKDAFVVDLAGKIIMPGMVDAHGHLDSAWNTGVGPKQQPARFAALAFGVTTNFDPFPSEIASYESTEMTDAGLMVGPRWIGTGRAVHGRAEVWTEYYNPIDRYSDAEAVLTRKAALGGICIKSYKQPARRKRQMLVKAARAAGINVVVEGETHFYNNVSMILDGHTNLEHNLPIANYYEDLVQFLALARAHNTPTLVVCFGELFGENYMYQTTEAWRDPKIRTFVQGTVSGYSPLGALDEAPPYARGMTSIHVADEIYDVGFRSVSRSVKKLDDAGVVINAGSHGQVPGLAMHWEMWLLAEGGMAPMRVLRTATINPARTLGIDHDLGSVEPGKLADLIVLDGDPLTDIRQTDSVRYTMVNGRLYDSQSMDEIGNRPRPRRPFYWETQERHGIEWNETWARR